jgi:hypothetical protein
MDYEIVNLYTEHLNISSFKSIVDEENIESMAKFNTSIIPLNQDNLYNFLIEFTLRAVENPITLEWRGIGIIKYEGQDNLTEDVLLNDETIEEFVNETMDKISFLLNSKLPNLIEEIKRKK